MQAATARLKKDSGVHLIVCQVRARFSLVRVSIDHPSDAQRLRMCRCVGKTFANITLLQANITTLYRIPIQL